MTKAVKPTTKMLKQRAQVKTTSAMQRRWQAEEDAAWKAVEGMWAGQKLEDPVAYQRRIRRDRPLPR